MTLPLFTTILSAAERGRIPDAAIRFGIRRLLAERADEAAALEGEEAQRRIREFVAACRTSPVAVATDQANAQHYEVPTKFFQQVLGPRLKYSCCHFGPEVHDLEAAEISALRTTCERAGLADGQSILELGCGWGSLSLWMAAAYPSSRITAVSNSASQRLHIVREAQAQGLANLDVITADIATFEPAMCYDRVVSIEMFEHMRNHAELLRRIATWLVSGGRLFVHIFCHRSLPYLFEDQGPQDWMTRHFFEGGMMPSDALLQYYQSDLSLVDQWRWSGIHYQKTCEAWLRLCDERREAVLPILQSVYPTGEAEVWLQRWRIFFMACAELFGYRGGREWWVAHYLFGKE